MAAMDFPSSPTNGQVYGNYVYSTAKGAWQARPVTSEVAVISPTAPTSPKAGDIWYNSDDGCTYVYYYDGDSYQWVASRNDATFSSTLGPRVDALENGAINYVLNSAMEIAQRGTSFSNPNVAYTLDRWCAGTHAAATVTQQAGGPTGFKNFIRYQRNSGSTVTTGMTIAQSIESVNSIPMAGSQVTLSFYARAGANYSAASSALQVYVISGTGTDQNIFGTWTGSTNVVGSTATLTANWVRYSFTGTVPANATQVSFYFNQNPVGTAGASDYYDITGVQLQVGVVATTFRRNQSTYQAELTACQRYYQYSTLGQPAFTNGNVKTVTVTFTPPMRATPTTSVAGIPGITANGGDQYHSKFYTASGPGENYATSMMANAEL